MDTRPPVPGVPVPGVVVVAICAVLLGVGLLWAIFRWNDSPVSVPVSNPAAQVAALVPHWIWYGSALDHSAVYLRKSFVLEGPIRSVGESSSSAILTGSGDNHLVVYLNGKQVLVNDQWERPLAHAVAKHLRPGKNVIAVEAKNEGGPAAIALQLMVDGRIIVASDGSWMGSDRAHPRWQQLDVESEAWTRVTIMGPVGEASLPWSTAVTAASFGATAVVQPETRAPQKATVDPRLNLPEGFRGELVYTVPKSRQGSWVCLTVDDKGRLYASDQGDKGLYRITPASLGQLDSTTLVEQVDVPISGAQGMCWLNGVLYANLQNRGTSGVWRITDTDGDDRLDDAEHLIPFKGGGEHGPHAIIPTADGQHLLFVGGNHSPLPKYQGSQAPNNWKEDLLLPRQWDARGHARGLLAPGGWIARCDLDGKNIQVISQGYRNQYDIALNHAGDLFTYDADMEWDMGSPWYRPTRVCLATSGSEFGWRSGTGKWPEYYEDSVPPILDIGPGSPTGVTFGYGAKFPARYQDALYILDWTFGTIYAVHLKPDGSTYSATKEEFVSAIPLAVTDAVIGNDGAFYFAVGGRGTQSSLYRIYYAGDESTAPSTRPAALTDAQRTRRELGALHGRVDAATVSTAWPYLKSNDRAIRYAARIAIECQPVDSWRGRALAEADVQASIMAMIALSRQGTRQDLPPVLKRLAQLPIGSLPEQQQLATLRTYMLALIRLGRPNDRQRAALTARLDAIYPTRSSRSNTELARLLTYLQSSTVVPKTMALMAQREERPLPDWAELLKRNGNYGGPIAKMLADMPPLQNILYAFILRNATDGWTLPLRRQYFQFFNEAAKHPGGASYIGFLDAARAEAIEDLSPDERLSLASITGEPLIAEPPKGITDPVGPGRKWTVVEAVRIVGSDLYGRSYARGRNLYHATMCGVCHGFNGEGGAIGPDLTTVASKFSVTDLFEAIVEPSKVISDQYGSEIVTLNNGDVIEGRVVHDEYGVRVFQNDPKEPPVAVKETDIKSIDGSPMSQMQTELIDGLNPEELKDLTAFLLSGGDMRSAVFKPHPNRVVYEGDSGPGYGKHIVFVAGDHEYRGEESLPALARILAKRYGFKCSVFFTTDPQTGDIKPGSSHLTGLASLKSADLLVVFLRFQHFPDAEMQHIVDYLDRGGPVLGLRTSTHGFQIEKDAKFAKYSSDYPGADYKGGFGRQVLGETWVGHYGKNHKQSSSLILQTEQRGHPILRGVKDVWVQSGGYKADPISGSQTLALGRILNGMTPDSPPDKAKKELPVAWVREHNGANGTSGRVFTTTHGASEDILNPGFRRMLVNATLWCASLEDAIKADNDVRFVGPYQPVTFGFDDFVKDVKPHELSGWETPILPKKTRAK